MDLTGRYLEENHKTQPNTPRLINGNYCLLWYNWIATDLIVESYKILWRSRYLSYPLLEGVTCTPYPPGSTLTSHMKETANTCLAELSSLQSKHLRGQSEVNGPRCEVFGWVGGYGSFFGMGLMVWLGLNSLRMHWDFQVHNLMNKYLLKLIWRYMA